MSPYLKQSKFLFFTLGLVSIIAFLGCKKPVADFQLTKYEYIAGESIQYINHAENDRSNLWEIINPDGTVSNTYEENHPTLRIDLLAPNGTFKVKLTSYNKRKKKSSTVEKEFLVKSVKKTLSINGTTPYVGDQKNFKVYVDGQYLGNSTDYSFMNYGTFSTSIPVGVRLVKIVSESETHDNVYDFSNHVYIAF